MGKMEKKAKERRFCKTHGEASCALGTHMFRERERIYVLECYNV